MEDKHKSKDRLLHELSGLRLRVAELEEAEKKLRRRAAGGRKSEEQLGRAFEQAAVGISHLDLSGRFLRVNQKFCNIVLYSRKELLKRTIQEITYPEDLENDVEKVREMTGGLIRTYSTQKRYIRKDGLLVWANVTVSLILNSSGKPVHLISVVEDITERKMLEELLRESDECFRAVIERCNDGIFIVKNNLYFYANHKIAEMCGYSSPDEIIGKPKGMFAHPDDKEMAFKIQNRRMRGEIVPTQYPVRTLRKDGTFFHSEVSVTKIMHRGEPATVIFVRDITERKRSEEELLLYKQNLENLIAERTAKLTEVNRQLKKAMAERIRVEKTLYENEERHRIIVEQTGQLVYDLDILSGKVTRSGAIRKITGYPPNEWQGDGDTWKEHIHPDDVDNVELLLGEAMRQGMPYHIEYRFIRKDGSAEFIEDNGTFMMNGHGKPYRMLGTMKDITLRKEAEQSLRESEIKFRDLAEKSVVGIYLIQDWVFKYVNEAQARLHGCTVQEMLDSMGPKDCTLPEEWPRIERSMKRRLHGKLKSERIETRILTKSNEIKNVEIYGTATIYQGRPALIGTLLDITERKKVLDELRKSKEELENKTTTLEELNVALKVLLRQRQEDRKDLEERFASNMKELVLPFIEKMKKGRLDAAQKSCLNIVEANLAEIVSPFVQVVRRLNLTPRESQVAALVKDGKTTKEIAELIGLACSAIDSYRNSIRSKLSLRNNKLSLQSYLRSLS